MSNAMRARSVVRSWVPFSAVLWLPEGVHSRPSRDPGGGGAGGWSGPAVTPHAQDLTEIAWKEDRGYEDCPLVGTLVADLLTSITSRGQPSLTLSARGFGDSHTTQVPRNRVRTSHLCERKQNKTKEKRKEKKTETSRKHDRLD